MNSIATSSLSCLSCKQLTVSIYFLHHFFFLDISSVLHHIEVAVKKPRGVCSENNVINSYMYLRPHSKGSPHVLRGLTLWYLLIERYHSTIHLWTYTVIYNTTHLHGHIHIIASYCADSEVKLHMLVIYNTMYIYMGTYTTYTYNSIIHLSTVQTVQSSYTC